MDFKNQKPAQVVLKDGRIGMLEGITRIMELDGYWIKFDDGERYCADPEEVASIRKVSL